MLFCAVLMCKLHLEIRVIYCCIMAISVGSAMRGENIKCLLLCLLVSQERILLWLLCQPGENKHVCSSCSSLSLLLVYCPCFVYLGFNDEYDSVNSKTFDIRNRISDTMSILKVPPLPNSMNYETPASFKKK